MFKLFKGKKRLVYQTVKQVWPPNIFWKGQKCVVCISHLSPAQGRDLIALPIFTSSAGAFLGEASW